jgi:hypothetical protein
MKITRDTHWWPAIHLFSRKTEETIIRTPVGSGAGKEVINLGHQEAFQEQAILVNGGARTGRHQKNIQLSFY